MASGRALQVRAKLTDNSKVFDALMRDLKEPGAGVVHVGVLQEDKSEFPDLAMIATVHEFGASISGTAFGNITIPARPFIRTAADEAKQEVKEAAGRLWRRVLAGEISKFDALTRIGLLLQARIRKKIQTLREPANAPATLHPSVGGTNPRGKKSDNPLIDKGVLVNAINFVVRKK